MSVITGFILACAVVTLGACGLTGFALYLQARDAREQAQRSTILRVDGYRARQH